MRKFASVLLFDVGVAAALVGAAKLMFGIAIDLPPFPRIPLHGVNVAVALGVALVAFTLAALVGRSLRRASKHDHRAPAA